ncbi:MAG: DUF3179 domain-containing protein [Planctomycetota bacterium]|nr:DUF3179 domain-containing protein [Planctomycetota bacterium]
MYSISQKINHQAITIRGVKFCWILQGGIEMTDTNEHLSTDTPQVNPPSETVPKCGARRTWKEFLAIAVLLSIIGGAGWEIWRLEKEDNERRRGGGPGALHRQAVLDFDMTDVAVQREEILNGGPGKDGIPSLSHPPFIPAESAKYLKLDERIIGVALGDDVRAYPLSILNYHEIINDTVNETPVAVTYCPLCDSAAVFDRRTPLGEREFGVSGLLYNSNVLMFDREGEPDSLWSQVKTEGISGPAIDKNLKALPLELTTWKDWMSRYPQTQVMSSETGHSRDYQLSPYDHYFNSPELMFPVKLTDDRFPKKSRMIGVWTENTFRAYPESLFSEELTRIDDEMNGKKIAIEYQGQRSLTS